MKGLRIYGQGLALLVFSLAPFGWSLFYLHQSFYHSPITKAVFLDKIDSKPALVNSSEQVHERYGVLKQIWFRPITKGASLLIHAKRSLLTLETAKGLLKAQEKLYEVTGCFQDQASLQSTHGWMLRIMRSKMAGFDYIHQTLQAKQVSLEIYALEEPLILSEHKFSNLMRPFIAGSAQKVKINCQARPPKFQALRFKAYINPSASKVSQ
jgi:hypothetical protein